MYYVGQSFRVGIIDGIAVILDLKENAYFMLDRVSTAMLCALVKPENGLVGATTDPDSAGAASRIDPNALGAFLTECLDRGMLTKTAPASSGRLQLTAAARPYALGLRAWIALFLTWLLLKSKPLESAYLNYQMRPKPASPRDESLVDRALKAFLRAENFFFLKQAPLDCLPRSLSLFRFLNDLGIDCTHIIGVRRTPFHAHAWVEIGDVPVFGQAIDQGMPPLARM
jgi:Transglutaminase-like superfamily